MEALRHSPPCASPLEHLSLLVYVCYEEMGKGRLKKKLLKVVLCPVTNNTVGLYLDGLLVTSPRGVSTSLTCDLETLLSMCQLMQCSPVPLLLSLPQMSQQPSECFPHPMTFQGFPILLP